jgi:hypothetical protein
LTKLTIQKNIKQNAIPQVIMKPCKFWNESVNMIRIHENGQQIQNDVIVVTFGSPLKWVFKVSPIRLGRLIEVGFVPCGWPPFICGKATTWFSSQALP